MQLAPMPDHGRVGRPDWQSIWDDYEPVTTTLRTLGLPVDIETCGGENHITVDLPNGSHLLIVGHYSLPNRIGAVPGWRVMLADDDNPTVDDTVYDSTPDGEHSSNGPLANAMLAAVMGWVIENYPETADTLAAATAETPQCNCIFDHPMTDEAREAVANDLREARRLSDLHGIQIALIGLTGRCRARDAAASWRVQGTDFLSNGNAHTKYHGPFFDDAAGAVADYLEYVQMLRSDMELIVEIGSSNRLLSLWRVARGSTSLDLRAVWVAPPLEAPVEPATDAN
ncbi:hypothetical protein [Streptacidiphilus cavernicola]|uniref:Uncharacterized protein n=1 Tax=Streptacidiphilus cavernicola TaxID=3342716 RepID=A0ABV6VNU2_9ACTN